jgi:hypothetical protein
MARVQNVSPTGSVRQLRVASDNLQDACKLLDGRFCLLFSCYGPGRNVAPSSNMMTKRGCEGVVKGWDEAIVTEASGGSVEV